MCGELVRLGTDGTAHKEIVARVAERLKDYPAIDCERLVRIATGEATDAILLNVPAFEAVAAEVKASLSAASRTLGPNPAESALERLVGEARALIAK